MVLKNPTSAVTQSGDPLPEYDPAEQVLTPVAPTEFGKGVIITLAEDPEGDTVLRDNRTTQEGGSKTKEVAELLSAHEPHQFGEFAAVLYVPAGQ